MVYSEDEIKKAIKEYIVKGGGSYSTWYVGVSKDARERLFNGHGVHEKGDWWIYRQAYSSSSARNIETYFVDLGTDGASGGGDEEADHVYAYKKNDHTEP